jgi:outer membrane protein W
MKKHIIAFFILLASMATVNAQSLWNITYDVAVPLGTTSDFISKVGFRGFGIDGRGFINQNVTLGGSWEWNVLYSYEKNRTTTEGNVTVTGNHYNYGNYMPIMFNAHYYFGEDGGIRPYIGTGVGTIWKEERKDIGSFNVKLDNNWQFGITPEVGVFIPVASSSLIFVKAKYIYGVQTSQLDATSYISFGVGIAWENF